MVKIIATALLAAGCLATVAGAQCPWPCEPDPHSPCVPHGPCPHSPVGPKKLRPDTPAAELGRLARWLVRKG